MHRTNRIAVIGAGIAGLTAAVQLTSRGFDVEVFEKSRGLGGRMATRRTRPPGDMRTDSPDAAGEPMTWQCDHGAPAFTAATAAFQAEVARWEVNGLAARWHAKGCTQDLWVGCPTMTAPARGLAGALTNAVRTTMTVDGLAREAGRWSLHCVEEGWLPKTFDGVVLAMPAPQAKRILSTLSLNESSEASLSSGMRTALQTTETARMRGTWALLAHFGSRVAIDADWIEFETAPLALAVRDSSKPGRGRQEVWLLHASHAWSEANVEASSEWVTGELLAAFAKVSTITPISTQVHRWRYAAAVTAHGNGDTASRDPLNDQSFWDATLALGMCGDWLVTFSETMIAGVERAWLSGTDIGQRIGSD